LREGGEEGRERKEKRGGRRGRGVRRGEEEERNIPTKTMASDFIPRMLAGLMFNKHTTKRS
jgi:hypothetical protein